MMGRLKSDQGQLFYEFHLSDVSPKIIWDTVLDLSWLRSELAPHYSSTGRPSIDPELMIRMLIVGYVFAIRSERLICREVQVNLAYRWFCKLGIEDIAISLNNLGDDGAIARELSSILSFFTSWCLNLEATNALKYSSAVEALIVMSLRSMSVARMRCRPCFW
jgi:transposase